MGSLGLGGRQSLSRSSWEHARTLPVFLGLGVGRNRRAGCPVAALLPGPQPQEAFHFWECLTADPRADALRAQRLRAVSSGSSTSPASSAGPAPRPAPCRSRHGPRRRDRHPRKRVGHPREQCRPQQAVREVVAGAESRIEMPRQSVILDHVAKLRLEHGSRERCFHSTATHVRRSTAACNCWAREALTPSRRPVAANVCRGSSNSRQPMAKRRPGDFAATTDSRRALRIATAVPSAAVDLASSADAASPVSARRASSASSGLMTVGATDAGASRAPLEPARSRTEFLTRFQ